MTAFYGLQQHQWSAGDVRGTKPFTLYLIHDTAPQYILRDTTKGNRRVNVHLFDLKQELRARATARHPIHATDNIQETKDNLRALGLYDAHYAARRFASLAHVFHTLKQTTTLQWLVLRNFEQMPHNITLDEHNDVDLLVNDYYTVKAVLDADSATGNRLDDGGHRVLHYVWIANTRVLFDFRHVGDNYYDRAMQEAMLQQRCAYQMFYVPNYRFHLYSLMYHALVHKRTISSTYIDVFRRYGIVRVDTLATLLNTFMRTHGYAYVRPEPSVGFFVENVSQ